MKQLEVDIVGRKLQYDRETVQEDLNIGLKQGIDSSASVVYFEGSSLEGIRIRRDLALTIEPAGHHLG